MPYTDIGREIGTREAAYWDKPEEAAQKAGVTKDLLLALAAQKTLADKQAAQRNSDMGMQIPAGSIVEQNMQLLQQQDPRMTARNTGGVAQQQAKQMQDRMRSLAGAGIAGATPPGMAAAAPRGGIADAVRPNLPRMAEGGVVPPPQYPTAPMPGLSPDAAQFLDMYKQFQRAMQSEQLTPEQKAQIERNFQLSTQNFSTDTKAEAFNHLDTETGLGADLKMRCGGMVNKYNRGGVVAFQGGGDVAMDRLLDSLRMVESGGNPNAVSPAGARGAYQIMPATARDPGYGVSPIDLETATEEEQREFVREYLTALIREFGGDVEKALAAYNAGPGRVARGEPLPRETQEYVPKVLGRALPSQTPERPLQPMMPESGIASAAPRNMALQPIREREVDSGPTGELPPKDRLKNYLSGLASTGSEYLSTLPERASDLALAAGDKIRGFGAGYAERMPSMQELAEGKEVTPRRVGSAMREFVTAPLLSAAESAEDFGRGLIGLPERQVQTPPAAVQALQDPQPATDAQIPPMQPEPDPQTMIAQALKDRLGGGRPTAQATQPTGIAQAALNNRIAEMTDPKRNRYSDFATFLANAGGHRNMGEMAKSMVGGVNAQQQRRKDALDDMLNKQLNRETEKSIYASRNQASIQEAEMRAQAIIAEASRIDPKMVSEATTRYRENIEQMDRAEIVEQLEKNGIKRSKVGEDRFDAEVERLVARKRNIYVAAEVNSLVAGIKYADALTTSLPEGVIVEPVLE